MSGGEDQSVFEREDTVTLWRVDGVAEASWEATALVQVRDDEGLTLRGCLEKERGGCL